MTIERYREAGLPPHDITAEEAVIAAILIDERAIFDVMPLLHPMDFYRDRNAWCYEAAIALADRGDAVTIPTLAQELDNMHHLDAAGGEPYLAEVAGKFFTAIGVEAHARIVARNAYYRRLIAASGQIVQLAYEGGPEPERIIEQARKLLEGAGMDRATVNALTAAEVVEEALSIEDARPVITTGLKSLDLALGGGFGIGELVTIGAHTSVGKTALAARIAYSQCYRGVPVGYIPVEGMATKIMHRMAAYEAGVSMAYAQRYGWGPGEEATYRAHLEMLGALPLFFPTPVPRTPDQIEHWMRRMARSEGVKHFIVDHIDRVNFPTGRDRNLVAAIRDAMTRWGNLANEEGFVVTVLSQVNRDAEWHPHISGLRESGAKEELAQIVLMLSQGDDQTVRYQRDAHERDFPSMRLGPRRGIQLNVEVAKLTEGRIGYVTTENGTSALYIDAVSGGVMEVGE